VFFVHNFSLPLFAPIFIYILFSSTCTVVYIFIQIAMEWNGIWVLAFPGLTHLSLRTGPLPHVLLLN